MADADIKIKVQAEADTKALDEVQGKIDNLGDQSGQGLAGAFDEAAESAANLSGKLDGAGQAGRQVGSGVVQGSAVSLQGIKSVGSGLDWLKAKWVMVAQAASGMFGAIGLVTQAWNFAKGIYDQLTEAERQRKEASKQAAEQDKQLAKELNDQANKSNTALANSQTAKIQNEAVQSVLQTYKDINAELQKRLRLTQECIDLEQGIRDDRAAEDRLKVEEDYLRGRLNDRQKEVALERIDLESNQRRRKARQDKAAAEVDILRENRNQSENTYNALLNKRDSYQSAAIMTPQEYEDSAAKVAALKSTISQSRDEIENTIDVWKKSLAYTRIAKAQDELDALEVRRKESDSELMTRGFQPQGGVTNQMNAAAAYVGQLNTIDEALNAQRKVVDQAEEMLLSAQAAQERLAAKVESEQAVDDQQKRTSETRRSKEAEDQKTVKTQERINQDLQITQTYLADTSAALEETKRNIQDQARGIKERAAGLADQQQGNARTAMVDKVLDMVSSGGGVDAAELDLLTNLRDRLSQQSGGDAEGRQQIISMLSEIISSLASNQKDQKKAQAKIDALQRQLDRIKQQQKAK